MNPIEMETADGSRHMARVVSVHTLAVGLQMRTNVAMTVTDGMTLLGLPVLNAIGKFTVESGDSNLLIFD